MCGVFAVPNAREALTQLDRAETAAQEGASAAAPEQAPSRTKLPPGVPTFETEVRAAEARGKLSILLSATHMAVLREDARLARANSGQAQHSEGTLGGGGASEASGSTAVDWGAV